MKAVNYRFQKYFIDKDKILNVFGELKRSIEEFKYKANIIEEVLKRTTFILEKYYKINHKILNNYNTNKRNYHELQNVCNLNSNFEIILNNMKNIINSNNFIEKQDIAMDYYYNINGEKYLGETKDGLKEGKGILFFNKEDEYERREYEGTFNNDKKEGKGIIYFKNGDKFEGEFINNKIEGKGIIYYKNGDKFEGILQIIKRKEKELYIIKMVKN